MNTIHEKCLLISANTMQCDLDSNSVAAVQKSWLDLLLQKSHIIACTNIESQSISTKTRCLDIKYSIKFAHGTPITWSALRFILPLKFVFIYYTAFVGLNITLRMGYAVDYKPNHMDIYIMQKLIPNDINKIPANVELIHFKELIVWTEDSVYRVQCPFTLSDTFFWISFSILLSPCTVCIYLNGVGLGLFETVEEKTAY